MPHFSQSHMLLYLSHLQINYVIYFARYPKIDFIKLDKMDIAINQNCNNKFKNLNGPKTHSKIFMPNYLLLSLLLSRNCLLTAVKHNIT